MLNERSSQTEACTNIQRSSQKIQHIIPVVSLVSDVFLSYVEIYQQNSIFFNVCESVEIFFYLYSSGAGQCLFSSSVSTVYPNSQDVRFEAVF